MRLSGRTRKSKSMSMKMKQDGCRGIRGWWWLIVGLLGLLVNPAHAGEGARGQVTAVLGAMPDEVQLLEGHLQGNRTNESLGIKFYTGTLAGRSVVLAYTGVGKVNAAMTTTLVLDHYHPAELLFTGVAGGVNTNLGPGDIVLGAQVVQHDFGEITDQGVHTQPTPNPLTGKANPLYFAATDRLLGLAETAAQSVPWEALLTSQGRRTPRVVRGVIVTGDVFVASPVKSAELQVKFKADAVEMEGGAVSQVCAQQGVPCLVIRSLSDRADAAANLDFEKFFRTAATNSAHLSEAILGQLAHEAAP